MSLDINKIEKHFIFHVRCFEIFSVWLRSFQYDENILIHINYIEPFGEYSFYRFHFWFLSSLFFQPLNFVCH